MISSLRGSVLGIEGNSLEVDVRGVGYEVVIPTRLADSLTIGGDIALYTHMHISIVFKSIQTTLYGFGESVDRTVFRHLLSVNKLGPRTAVSIISALSGVQIANAIQSQDQSVLSNVSGIGKKTASSILFELRDAVSDWNIADASVGAMPDSANGGNPHNQHRNQAILALRQLGFTKTQSEGAVGQVFEEDLDVNTLTYRALSVIRQL